VELRAERRRAGVEWAEALRAAEARLHLALDAARLGDWELDLRTGHSPRRSLRHDRIFGYPGGAPDWSYDRFLGHVHPDDREEVDRRYRMALEQGEPWDFECRIRRVDGELRWIWARGGVHRNARGVPVRAIGLILDATDRKEAEAERERLLAAEREARGAAEAANRSKGQFLAVMSHELRTPLNAIAGYADLIDMDVLGPVTEEQRDALARIKLSQQHLLTLINEVLSYAKLESGSVQYRVEVVPLQQVLASLAPMVEPQARARQQLLRIGDCPPELRVQADPEKLRQILLNLVGNAIKFTPAGGQIDVACEDGGDGPDGDAVLVHVTDNGVGIAAEKLDNIFEPFVQGSSGLTRPAEGTGLGLAISRDLARGMDGDLRVQSAPGQGSRFTVVLPRAHGREH
jgi:signal transduction histidine kinase